MSIERSIFTFDLPARPSLLAQLTEAAEREDVSMDAIAELVEEDPGLAAAVVRSSNSAFHSMHTKRQITSVRQSVNLLGLRELIAFSTGAFLRRSFPSATPEIEKLWALSAQTAEKCAEYAQLTGAVPRDVAYTYGLFRYVGCAVLLMQVPGYTRTIQKMQEPGFAQEERSKHGIDHAQIGGGLVVRWGMARPMVEAVGAAASSDWPKNQSISPEAKAILAIGILAQFEVSPSSIDPGTGLVAEAKALVKFKD